MEKIKERIFPFLIALSALSVSASAAFYSVSGLSKLFAGASLEVIIMASSLEVAKLVIASLLYQYWDKLNNTLKVYLTIACTVLILITSMGIYGFLSSAYQETANKDGAVTQQVTALETKKGLYEQNRDNILKEKQSLAELKGTLSKGSTTQYTDKKGNLVVRSNNATIRNIESANRSDEKLSTKLDVVNDSIFSLENKILEVKTNGDNASELGPLKYLSELTGVEMNRIINWLLLVIIFVFDPLAIALVISANFAFSQLRKTSKYDKLTEEDKEWLEADLVKDEEPKSTGTPVMVDPKTGKFYYEEPEENIYGEDQNFPPNKVKPKNLDLDGDGVVEEEELQQIFDEADTNDDGIVDEEEAKLANLSIEDTNKLNQFNESLQRLENVTNSFTSAEYGKKMEALEEVTKLRELLTQQFQSRKDDDTITYF
jgi:hypothetical protein